MVRVAEEGEVLGEVGVQDHVDHDGAQLAEVGRREAREDVEAARLEHAERRGEVVALEHLPHMASAPMASAAYGKCRIWQVPHMASARSEKVLASRRCEEVEHTDWSECRIASRERSRHSCALFVPGWLKSWQSAASSAESISSGDSRCELTSAAE